MLILQWVDVEDNAAAGRDFARSLRAAPCSGHEIDKVGLCKTNKLPYWVIMFNFQYANFRLPTSAQRLLVINHLQRAYIPVTMYMIKSPQ